MQVWNKLFGRSREEKNSINWTFGTVLVAASLGLIAALTLSIEKYHLLQNPDAVLTCSFNLVLNCSVVMKTWQASLFGFPNSLIGVVLYPAAMVLAVFALSKIVLPRWIMITAQVFATLGALFAYWLFFQSVYVIEVLCPWCLVVTFVTTLIFSSITHYNLRENTFKFSKSIHVKVLAFMKKDYDKLVTAGWIVLLICLVVLKFGDSLLT